MPPATPARRPGRAAAPRPPARPSTGPIGLDARLPHSGLAAAGVLTRAGRRLGFLTVRDLLFHLPKRYDDLREMSKLGDLVWTEEGTAVSARVRVADIHVEPTFRRRVQKTVARLEDDTGWIEATWFGRRFIERRLHAGDRIVISGRLKRFRGKASLDNPDFQHDTDEADLLHVGRIVPVYKLTAGLTAARLRTAVREALDRAGLGYEEYLPSEVLAAERLPSIARALGDAHYPSSFEARDDALRRLAFDELLALQVGMIGRRRQRGREAARAIQVEEADDALLRESLTASIGRKLGREVDLTPDQVAAVADIRADLARPTPMLRLLQGDVGSGKTAVAAWALAAAARAGLQGALLAPTDLLARQHTETVGALLQDAGIGVTLLTGSLKGDAARKALEAIRSGQAGVVVGTHALIQDRVDFAALGLVVVDEQHRFGVDQRGQLEAKAGGTPPHVLLMTATPIPRTLGQVLYADLDVSNLRTPPEGRIPIRTGIRRPDDLDGTWARVRAEAAAGHGTFVVVPAIEESDDEGAVAAETEAVRLRDLLKLEVGLVHGRMKPADRDATMARFRDGDLMVIVGTTVIEVGVDVMHATMMVIEGADRFGLAQLHQLRGRVGRGTVESFCVLVSDTTDEVAQARLRAVAELRDGFELADKDWELRREGDVLGYEQSGLPRLRVASLQDRDHRELVGRARAWAERLVDEAGDLRPEAGALSRELRSGWLERIAAGEPATGA